MTFLNNLFGRRNIARQPHLTEVVQPTLAEVVKEISDFVDGIERRRVDGRQTSFGLTGYFKFNQRSGLFCFYGGVHAYQGFGHGGAHYFQASDITARVREMARERVGGAYNVAGGDDDWYKGVLDPRQDSSLEINGRVTQEQLQLEEEAMKRVFENLRVEESGSGKKYFWRGVPDIA